MAVAPSVKRADPSHEIGTGQTQPSLAFLSGGGELGAMVRAYDWSKTPLVRISHTAWCVGAANQRKLLCSNDLSPTRRAPRCRQSVARICLDSQLLKDAK